MVARFFSQLSFRYTPGLVCLLLTLLACGSPPPGVEGIWQQDESQEGMRAEGSALGSCGNRRCEADESYVTCAQDCTRRVGTFYSGWHWPAYNAVDLIRQAGKTPLSMEDVLRSRRDQGPGAGTGYTYADILKKPGVEGAAGLFSYQHFPQVGPYCLVHRRSPGDINYYPQHEGNYGLKSAPDCPNYKQTLKTQAAQMVTAGIDYVVLDGTNLTDNAAFTDAIQLRPFEVMVQEFSALRNQGIKTPEVAMWQRFPKEPVRASDGGDWGYKRVLNIYNSGKYNNVLMRDAKTGKFIYFYPDTGGFDTAFIDKVNANGGRNNIIAVPMWAYGRKPRQWSFMSACQQSGEIDDRPCNQPWTQSSVLGSQMAVVPSYQINYASLYGGAAGVLGGLTLRKQFSTAFAVHPDYLLLSSWNEAVTQPQRTATSMGLETDPTAQNVAFVDLFGVEYSRDIEPSKEYGARIYDLVKSCLRVYRSGSTTCNDPAEACCQGGNFSDRYVRYRGPQGNFIVAAPKTGGGAGKVPLYACSAGSYPFFSPRADCERQRSLGMVGYMSNSRGGEYLRSLFRCVKAGTAVHAYGLNASCPQGMQLEAVLGYVR